MTTERTIHRRPFALGRTLITPGAQASLSPDDIQGALTRHAGCDWGECGTEDWAENDFSVDNSLRLLSVYHDRNGLNFWIITEAERQATTLLLPKEY